MYNGETSFSNGYWSYSDPPRFQIVRESIRRRPWVVRVHLQQFGIHTFVRPFVDFVICRFLDTLPFAFLFAFPRRLKCGWNRLIWRYGCRFRRYSPDKSTKPFPDNLRWSAIVVIIRAKIEIGEAVKLTRGIYSLSSSLKVRIPVRLGCWSTEKDGCLLLFFESLTNAFDRSSKFATKYNKP